MQAMAAAAAAAVLEVYSGRALGHSCCGGGSWWRSSDLGTGGFMHGLIAEGIHLPVHFLTGVVCLQMNCLVH
jgi:hypothetical protein